MRKRIICGLLSTLMLMIMFSACGQKRELAQMTAVENDDYVAIVWEDRTYVPYCVVNNADRGEQIGIVDGDENDQVYEYKGYSTEEWLISFYHSGEMDGSMLMREKNVADIPEGLESEYKWNQ